VANFAGGAEYVEALTTYFFKDNARILRMSSFAIAFGSDGKYDYATARVSQLILDVINIMINTKVKIIL